LILHHLAFVSHLFEMTIKMKKLALTYVAVKRISSSVPATEFNRTDLETATRTSLELGGFVQPPVLRRTGKMTDMTYTVVSGHGQIPRSLHRP
jgi:hypothetical protein